MRNLIKCLFGVHDWGDKPFEHVRVCHRCRRTELSTGRKPNQKQKWFFYSQNLNSDND